MTKHLFAITLSIILGAILCSCVSADEPRYAYTQEEIESLSMFVFGVPVYAPNYERDYQLAKAQDCASGNCPLAQRIEFRGSHRDRQRIVTGERARAVGGRVVGAVQAIRESKPIRSRVFRGRLAARFGGC